MNGYRSTIEVGETNMSERSSCLSSCLALVLAATAIDSAFSQTDPAWGADPGTPQRVNLTVPDQLGEVVIVNRKAAVVPSAACEPIRPRAGGVACSLDVDGDGILTAMDGLFVARYLHGYRGNALSQGIASNACALNTTPTAIEAAIAPLFTASPPALDIDGDRKVASMIDGLLLLHTLRGRTGSAATSGVAPPMAGATRTTWTAIREYLNSNCNAGLSTLEQYTPNQADWSTFAAKPIAGGNMAHDPDSVSWITPAQWDAAKWDGTVYNPSRMTKAAFASAICPSGDRVRGIREVFYRHKPFADNRNPTKAEVDEWHRIAINHVRALVGYTSQDRLVKKDYCMFARAQWGDERKFTTKWDAKYPGTTGSAYGPCQGSTNGHCGSLFVPSPADQAPYLPEGHASCGTPGGAEGVFSAPKSNIPWSIKWSRAFCQTVSAEGFWGGHTGPWFHRELFGFSFWDGEPSNNGSNAILRAKWTGTSMPSLY
jgi:hypothetical protein